jgi:hypothetical protein
MTAYIVDTKKFKVEREYPDSSYASYAMSNNYGWHPDNQYRMLHNEDAAYEYWKEHVKDIEFKEWIGDKS